MDNMRDFNIDSILKAIAAEENSALNFDKWKADILSTTQFLQPATTKFKNNKITRIYEFTRSHGVAIAASAAALIITLGVGNTLLNKRNTAAPEAAMPQAARIADDEETTPELFSTAPVDETIDTAEVEPFAYDIANDEQDTGTAGAGEAEITTEEPIEPAKIDDPPGPGVQGAAADPGSTLSVTDDVKKIAIDSIVNTLALNDIDTSGMDYENANIIVVQHGEYTCWPLVPITQNSTPKTDGEYEGPVYVVTFTLPDWTIKQYALSMTTYEVLGEVTFG